MRGRDGGGVTSRAFAFVVLAVLLCVPTRVMAVETSNVGIDARGVSGAAVGDLQQEQHVEAADDVTCNSLTGPFCLHTGSVGFFAAYMTPISPLDLEEPVPKPVAQALSAAETMVEEQPREKECFFQHFASSWMDSGGAANDLMSRKVDSVDDCERLCCQHAQCRSFTFWRGRTCFLRAQSMPARADDDSFSGVRLT